ncbi:ATP-binding protein [Acidisphaera sp. S103]|uniref:ATP-binding protein n=1 Tax=Acidisphaera sp. S103 TaxID=1747223 RepID=UPI00131A8552|nr:ATP-binding protein [Acidisphaera sp. S103]
MTSTDTIESRILILAPIGRDAPAIGEVLKRVGLDSLVCCHVAALVAALDDGAGAVLVAEEALVGREAQDLQSWVVSQPPWSDMPFIVLVGRDTRPELMRWRQDWLNALRNGSLLEKPLDGLTLSSASAAAVRSRRRQYEVRSYLAARAAAAETLEELVVSRTQELETANAALRVEMAERERAEAALRQSQKMEAVGQLTGGLAHDFNNMLAGISGSLEIMQVRIDQGRFGELGRYVSAALASSGRAAALTHRLLAFSRRQTLSPKPTDANALISGMGELIRRTVGPAVRVEEILADGVWTTLCDPNQLESALLNLVINARDAMPDGGSLVLEVANARPDDAFMARNAGGSGQYVVLSVSDTGTGMPAEVVSRAFDPFFTTKPIGEGTGLGLSMVYGFAKQSAGHVSIDSAVGRGTSIRIYLPRHSGDVAETGKDAATAVMPRARGGETVLVVDDEPTVRMLVCEVLGELGYAAIQAGDAQEGLCLLRSDHRIDLLITDVGLPNGMNGRQLADAAKVGRPDLQVLFITGYAEKVAMGGGRLGPGMDVITKPFALQTLAEKVSMMIA